MMGRSLCYTLSLHSASSFDVETSEYTYIIYVILSFVDFLSMLK